MSGPWLFYGAALVSAASWALGSVLWRRLGDRMAPVAMNLSKGFIGSLLLGGCMLWTPGSPPPWQSVAVLGVSGVVGISIGDTFFFRALMDLGPRLTSLFGALYPVSIALAAAAFLGERPSAVVWSGILVTTSGVGWVLWERSTPGDGVRDWRRGLGYAFLAMLSTTAAVLLAKIGVEAVPPLQASFVRLTAGTAGLLIWGGLTGGLSGWLGPLRAPALLLRVVAVVMVVAFGGFWLSLVALKNIDASVAGTLNATSPLFVLPLSVAVLGDRVTLRALIGTAVAVGGVALIFSG